MQSSLMAVEADQESELAQMELAHTRSLAAMSKAHEAAEAAMVTERLLVEKERLLVEVGSCRRNHHFHFRGSADGLPV